MFLAKILGILFLGLLVSMWLEEHKTVIIPAAIVIAVIISLVTFLKHRREVPKFDDRPIVPLDPPWEKLSGTFSCPACGGPNTFTLEENPSTACKYCGAEIPDIRIMILERNQRRQSLITDDLSRQQEDRQKRLDIHLQNLTDYRLRKQRQRSDNAMRLIKGTGNLLLKGILFMIVGLAFLFVLLKQLNLI